MKKAVILFLCIVITALALSSYVQSLGDNEKALSEETISSLTEADDWESGSPSDMNTNSDMSAPPYEPSPNNLEDNPGLELMLRENYLASYEKLWGTKYDLDGNEIKLESIFVLYYFGTVNGCEIALMPRYYVFPEITSFFINVADYTIVINTYFPLLAHCGSEFYELEDAYEKGLLTKEDIYEIGKLVETHGLGTIG